MRELLLIAALYVAYSSTRLFADDALAPALDRRMRCSTSSGSLRLDWEHALNRLFVEVDAGSGLSAATGTPPPTTSSPLWCWSGSTAGAPRRTPPPAARCSSRRSPGWCSTCCSRWRRRGSPRATSTCSASTRPTAGGARDASAPRGLGGFTNQLAAFPSLHAGWALWVALAIRSATAQPGRPRVRLDPRRRDRRGRRRHRQPLGPRRRRRLAWWSPRPGSCRLATIRGHFGGQDLASRTSTASNRPVTPTRRSRPCTSGPSSLPSPPSAWGSE